MDQGRAVKVGSSTSSQSNQIRNLFEQLRSVSLTTRAKTDSLTELILGIDSMENPENDAPVAPGFFNEIKDAIRTSIEALNQANETMDNILSELT